MARKHYSPEALLNQLIDAIEGDPRALEEGKQSAARFIATYQSAFRRVLTEGPIACSPTPDQVPVEELDTTRAELQNLFRSALRGARIQRPSDPIAFAYDVRITAEIVGGDVRLAATGDGRDLLLLQVVLLLDRVGLSTVRECGALGCGRLFVKAYRREYCSVRCQRRVYMRARRENERRVRERRRRRRQQT